MLPVYRCQVQQSSSRALRKAPQPALSDQHTAAQHTRYFIHRIRRAGSRRTQCAGGDAGTIRILGTGSINAGQNPLILVDNVEMSPDAGQESMRFIPEIRYWYAKLELMPVRQAERDVNPKLTQNPGWE